MAESDIGVGLARATVGMAAFRLLLFALPLLVLMGAGGLWIGDPSAGFGTQALLAILLVCAITVAFYRIAVRLLEGRSASELSFQTAVPWTIAGVLAGTLIFCLVYAILWAAGVARFGGFRGFDGVAAAFGVSLLAGVTEEILFRGAIYRIIENAFGTLFALVVSSALFGLVHAANPGATLVTTAMIAVEAGLMLGLAYSATRSLWFPIGLHFAWNFTQGGIFGAPISGFQFGSILDFALSGPEILTGGAFGPEASVVAFGVCVSASIVLGWVTVRRGQWRPLTAVPIRAQP